MPIRTITIDGARWDVMSSGRVTQYDRDEFALLFITGDGAERRVRTVRYSPQGVRARDQSLGEMSDADLARLFSHSQESATSPEAGYRR